MQTESAIAASPRHSIAALPAALINQIAAGEVVERPGSALKELLENSIDSGATAITVRLHGGGKDLIEVQDDGHGIPATEIPLALCRHATSKIRTLEDLTMVESMGFRGEALAAIASISKMKIVSRTDDSEMAASVRQEGGQIIGNESVSRTRGTTISVTDLFYNTPAREKFLKSPASETNNCIQIFQRIALSNPSIHLRLETDTKTKANFPACAEERERIAQVFAFILREPIRSEDLIAFSREKELISVHGFVLPMQYCTHNSRGIFTFVNGRVVRDKVLNQAILAGAKEVLFGHQYPQVALYVTTSPERVDVNVHPTKAEVRFLEPSPFGLIRVAVREALAKIHRAAELNPKSPDACAPGDQHLESMTDSAPFTPPVSHNESLPIELGRNYREKSANSWIESPHTEPSLPEQNGSAAARTNLSVEDSSPKNLNHRIMGLIHNTYVVCEDSDGLMLVDQHAAHERITYERLRKTKFHPPLRAQNLLIPIVVEIAANGMSLLEPLFPELKQFGLDLEQFGPEQIRVNSLPTLLLKKNGSPRISIPKLIGEFSLRLQAEEDSEAIAECLQNILLDTLASEACHGSVRAGQALSLPEIEALLQQMDETDFAAHCPHGRPTSVRLSWTDIEKLFKRKV